MRKETEIDFFPHLLNIFCKPALSQVHQTVSSSFWRKGALPLERRFAKQKGARDVCERARWAKERAKRSGSRRRTRANAFAKRDAQTATVIKSLLLRQKKAHICLPRQCVLFSTKFAFGEWNMASPCEIAPLWNICFANVRRRISFHIATKEQYFTISARELFHIRRKPNISLKIRNTLRMIYKAYALIFVRLYGII